MPITSNGVHESSECLPEEWLADGGEMGAMIRARDWSNTPLGPREHWPVSLRYVLNLILNSKFPMAILWGPDLLLFYNDAYCTIARDKHPSALSRSTREVWSEVWNINEPIFAAVMDRGETIYLEDKLFPITRGSRHENAYFTLCYSPVRGEAGAIVATLVTLLETTGRVRERETLASQRERAEALARRERELLSRVIERIPVMITIYDPALASFHVNEEFRRVLGFDDADARGRDFMALCYPDPDERERARTFMESAASGFREFRVVAKDGRVVESSWANVRLSDDTWVGIGIDLRERKEAEGELKRALAEAESGKRLLDCLMENVSIGLTIVDAPDLKLRALSRYARELTQRPREEIEGFAVETLAQTWGVLRADGTPALNEELPIVRATRKGEHVHEEEWILERPDRSRIPILCTAGPIRNSENAIVGGVIAWQDITDRKRSEEALRLANEQLRQADRRKNDFLAILSHELRNPLAPIRNSVRVLERAAPGSEQARRALQIIHRQAEQMTHLIDDLLDVTRISRGKVTLQRSRLDLNALIRAAVEDHQALYARSGISLEVEAPREPLWVYGDPTRLSQVIGNLLNNAVKFTPRGGRTELSVTTNDRNEAVVRVRDNGVGMNADTVSELFEPFAQAAQSIERSRGGLGLGLALVKSLVEMHGGRVGAFSEGEGKGAELTFVLPLESAREPMQTSESGMRMSSGARRVLVIEDNVDAAESLRDALELIGHEVAVGYSGVEGIELARALKPDVVLCDLGLPGVDGFSVARAIRGDTDPQVRSAFLVALSGYALREDVDKSKDAGFDRHLAKPAEWSVIEQTIAESLSRKSGAVG